MFGLLMKLLACLMLLGSVSAAHGTQQESPQKQVTSSDKATQKPEANSKQDSPAVKIAPPADNNQNTKQISEQNDSHPTPDWWLIGVTVALVVATGGLVYYARDTARKELRAYVGVEHVTIQDKFRGGPPGFGKFTIRNFGKTMAKDTQIWIVGTLKTVGEMTDFPLSDRRSKQVVMPNEPIGFDESIEIEAGDIQLFDQGIGYVYLWGRIEYSDVFGEPHWTTFRFVNYKRWISLDMTGWDLKTCDEGNDAT